MTTTTTRKPSEIFDHYLSLTAKHADGRRNGIGDDEMMAIYRQIIQAKDDINDVIQRLSRHSVVYRGKLFSAQGPVLKIETVVTPADLDAMEGV